MAEVRVPSNLFELNEIQILESCEYGDAMVVIWLKLVLKSRRVKNRRFVWKIANGIVLTDEILSHLFKIDILMCPQVFETLEKLKFIKRKANYIEVFRVWEGNQRNRNTSEYRAWRKAVYERDDYTCQICRGRGIELNAHHIIHWADSIEERFNVNNGITLCKPCHLKVHKRGD